MASLTPMAALSTDAGHYRTVSTVIGINDISLTSISDCLTSSSNPASHCHMITIIIDVIA